MASVTSFDLWYVTNCVRDVDILPDMQVDLDWFWKILSVRTITYAAEILIFRQFEWNFVSQILQSDTFRHQCYTANFATYKIHMKFIYITYEKYVISTHESYTHEFHMNAHACNMYEFCIYFIYIKLHIKYICTIYVNFIYITYIFHTFTKYICITYEFFHAYYIYKI